MPIKNRRFFAASLAFFFALVLGALVAIDRYYPEFFVKLVETKNKHAAEYIKQLNEDIESYSITSGTFQVRFKSRCLNAIQKDPDKISVLRPGDRFCEIVDHHYTSSMKIEEIEADRVIISYTTTFNHSSFGKRLIETDQGTFPWP